MTLSLIFSLQVRPLSIVTCRILDCSSRHLLVDRLRFFRCSYNDHEWIDVRHPDFLHRAHRARHFIINYSVVVWIQLCVSKLSPTFGSVIVLAANYDFATYVLARHTDNSNHNDMIIICFSYRSHWRPKLLNHRRANKRLVRQSELSTFSIWIVCSCLWWVSFAVHNRTSHRYFFVCNKRCFYNRWLFSRVTTKFTKERSWWEKKSRKTAITSNTSETETSRERTWEEAHEWS